MEQRLSAGDRDHRGAAFLNRLEALLGRKVLLQDVREILDLSATGACQVAAEQRLEHQHQRISLPAHQLLLQNIGCNRPGLRDWDCHPVSPPSKICAQHTRRCEYSYAACSADSFSIARL